MTIVHIAGVDVQVGTQLRQRCSWCGAVLIDMDLTRVARPLEPGEDPEHPNPWQPATWPVGALVEVDGTAACTIDHEDGARLPQNCCGQLDHAVTK